MTALKAVTEFDQIPKCEGDVAKDSKFIAIKRDDSDKWVPEFVELDDKAGVLGLIDENSNAASFPDVKGFINDKLLDDWMSICREEIPRKKRKPLQIFMVSKTPLAPKGVFDSCDKQSSAMRKFMDMPLSPEAAKYLKSKFAQDPGCSSIMEDGTIYYKLLADESQIKIAIASIEKDVKDPKFKFPDGVNKEMAQNLIGQLWAIAAQDPEVVRRKAMQEQQDMMSRNMAIQLTATGLLQLATTGVFAGFFLKQIKLQQKMMDQMAEQTGKVTWEEVARDLVEVERKAMAENSATVIKGRDTEALAYLRRISRPRRGHAFLLGPSGSGKDTIIRRAAQLLALEDPRIMAEPRLKTLIGKPLWFIEPTLLQAKGGIVGSGAKVMKLVRARLIAGEPVYWPELAQGITAFAHSKGSSESPAALLKTILDEAPSGFSASATEMDWDDMAESRLMGDRAQMERRFGGRPFRVKPLPMEVVLHIIKTHTGPGIARDYGIAIELNVMDYVIGKTQAAMNGGADSGALFDKIETVLMEVLDHSASKGETTLSRGVVDEVFSDSEFTAGFRKGGGGADAPADHAARVREHQIKMLRDYIMSKREFLGRNPESLARLPEIVYEKLSRLPQEEAAKLLWTEDHAALDEAIKGWLDEYEQSTKGSQGKKNSDPGDPPPAPAGGNGSPPPAPATNGGTASARSSLITPYTTVAPSPAIVDAASHMPIDAMIPDVNAALDRIPQLAPARAVTLEGFIFNVAAAADVQEAAPGVKDSVTMLPPGAEVLGGSKIFPAAAAMSVAGGAAGLVATEALAAAMGVEQLPWYLEFPAFVGSGMGLSAIHAVAKGATISLPGMGLALLHGLPSAVVTFGATGKYFADVGMEPLGRAHKWATVLGGSVLAAATTSATLTAGGMTVAELGVTTTGFAVGIGASIGVGAALLAGGAVGHFGNRWAAEKIGIVNSDGDTSISGWWADEAANMTPRSAQLMIHDIAAWF